MLEANQKELFANVITVLMVVLSASGIFVSTLPLESKRPANSESARMSHAGRQDVEARLWQDPFTVMRRVKGETPGERCEEAIKDRGHQLAALAKSIDRHNKLRGVTVLPVLVPGGGYFEDAEWRRRARYAVVTSLLNDQWVPSDDDRLGYTWTFESCIDNPWQAWIPEVLPWEWYTRGAAANPQSPGEALLVLWVNEDALGRRPLRGVNEIVKSLMRGGVPCQAANSTRRLKNASADERHQQALVKPATDKRACTPPGDLPLLKAAHCTSRADWPAAYRDSYRSTMPWCATRVLGPGTSEGLQGLVRDLADGPADSDEWPGPDWLRFYSSSATAATDGGLPKTILDRPSLEHKLRCQAAQCDKPPPSPSLLQTILDRRSLEHRLRCQAGKCDKPPPSLPELGAKLEERLLRLTTTDDLLAKALIEELKLRLTDPNPFWRLTHHTSEQALCGATVVIVAEMDVSYANMFAKHLSEGFADECDAQRPTVLRKSYLRGLDGVLPDGPSAPVAAVQSTATAAQRQELAALAQAAREHADGRSQYDYLRRLGEDLATIDVRERRDGKPGVSAIGVLGIDTYDRILVLQALRERFPKTVFFTADLDARMMGGDVTAWTRNLVVASAYGLTLHPAAQRNAPPFRDTYQAGLYLSTRVALDKSAAAFKRPAFDAWFASPQMFEIGRTRAVPLSAGTSDEDCTADTLTHCESPHRIDEWIAFPWPDTSTWFAVTLAALAASALAALACRGPGQVLRAILEQRWKLAAGSAVTALLLGGFGWAVWLDVSTHRGEPFAWLEGVSIWPSVFLQLLASATTVVLLWWYGFRKLKADIERIDVDFVIAPACGFAAAERNPRARLFDAIRSLWWLEADDPPQTPVETWLAYRDRMRLCKRLTRIAVTSLLAFVCGVALISIDWPNSTHRGVFSAWCNHLSLALALLTLMVALFVALDAVMMATRCMDRLSPALGTLSRQESERSSFRKALPRDAEGLATWFRLVVGLGASVHGLVYLPVVALLLLVVARARVFDAWQLPLAYALPLVIAILLLIFCAISLRRAAAQLRSQVVTRLDEKIAEYERGADDAATAGDSATFARHRLLAKTRATRRIKQLRDQILSERGGPFRPSAEDPIVRAILLLLGGSGAVTTLQYLFLSGG